MKHGFILQKLTINHQTDTETYIYRNAKGTKEFRLTIRGRRYISAQKIKLSKAA